MNIQVYEYTAVIQKVPDIDGAYVMPAESFKNAAKPLQRLCF